VTRWHGVICYVLHIIEIIHKEFEILAEMYEQRPEIWYAFVTWERLICHGISRNINIDLIF
jgi:hypothetical protein